MHFSQLGYIIGKIGMCVIWVQQNHKHTPSDKMQIWEK